MMKQMLVAAAIAIAALLMVSDKAQARGLDQAELAKLYAFYTKEFPRTTGRVGKGSAEGMEYALQAATVKTLRSSEPDIELLLMFWIDRMRFDGFWLDMNSSSGLSEANQARYDELEELAREQVLMAENAALVLHHSGFTPEERRELLQKAAPERRQFHLHDRSREFFNEVRRVPQDWANFKAFLLDKAEQQAKIRYEVLQQEDTLLRDIRAGIKDHMAKKFPDIFGHIQHGLENIEDLKKERDQRFWALMAALFSLPDPDVTAIDLPELDDYTQSVARRSDQVVGLFADEKVRGHETFPLLLNTTYSILGAARWSMTFHGGIGEISRYAILAEISEELRAAVFWLSNTTENHVLRTRLLEIAVAIDPLHLDAMQALAFFYFEAGRYDDAARMYDRVMRIKPAVMSAQAHVKRTASHAVPGNFKAAWEAAAAGLSSGIENADVRERLIHYSVYATHVLEGPERAEEVYIQHTGHSPEWDTLQRITNWWACELARVAKDYRTKIGEFYHRGYCFLPSAKFFVRIEDSDGNERTAAAEWARLLTLAKTMPVRPGPTDRALALTEQAFQLLDSADLDAMAVNYESLGDSGVTYDDVIRMNRPIYDSHDLFLAARAAAPWWPDGHYNLAVITNIVGDSDSAIGLMEDYLAITPNPKSTEADQARDLLERWREERRRYHQAGGWE